MKRPSAPALGPSEILTLYDRHARELLGYLARRTRDPQLALDLLSETFLAAFEHRSECRAQDDRAAAAWLWSIAASKLAGHYRRGAGERRARERLAIELRALTEPEREVIDRLAASAGESGIAQAMAALSEDQRQAVQARVIDERSYAAVARELGVSEPAARARVSRGLRALRRAVADEKERTRDEPA